MHFQDTIISLTFNARRYVAEYSDMRCIREKLIVPRNLTATVLNSTTTALNSTATALNSTTTARIPQQPPSEQLQLHPTSSSTLLSTQPFDRTLGGPFAELFSIRLSATRTLCVSIFSFISTSLVYMGIISRNSGFVNTFGENFVGEVANFDNS